MARFTRRQVLQGLGVALGGAAVGCGGGSAAGGPDAGGHGAGPADAGPPDADPCSETSDLSPEELLAPIDSIVVLMMENRSFDHFLGARRLVEGRAVEGLTGAETNPDPDGNPVGVFRLDDFSPEDPPHGWDACHEQWNAGANDGFVRAHAGSSQTQVMGYHTRDQLASLYPLADAFALCERWHCSLLGPTWPNRLYLHGATSNGQKSNLPVTGFTSLFSVLADAGVSVKNYFHDLCFASGGYFKLNDLAGIEQFFADAAQGGLPGFSIIDPKFVNPGANDDHPDHDIQLGQALIGSVYAALAASPQWERCLFVLTYDEHGGFYDHVAPPATVDAEPGFEQLGFRVPAIVAGPYVKAGCVVGETLEHVSVAATLSKRFGIAPMNPRVSATRDLSVCLSPSLIKSATPRRAPALPPVRVSSAWRSRGPVGEHAELVAAADRGDIPRAFDRRADSVRLVDHVLEQGRRLGAVSIED